MAHKQEIRSRTSEIGFESKRQTAQKKRPALEH